MLNITKHNTTRALVEYRPMPRRILLEAKSASGVRIRITWKIRWEIPRPNVHNKMFVKIL